MVLPFRGLLVLLLLFRGRGDDGLVPQLGLELEPPLVLVQPRVEELVLELELEVEMDLGQLLVVVVLELEHQQLVLVLVLDMANEQHQRHLQQLDKRSQHHLLLQESVLVQHLHFKM